jgi:5-methylcytosine-specific restriction protein A
MPSRAARPCAHGGCRAKAVNGPFCSAHAVSVRAARPYDAWRGSSASRGYDADWRRVRVLALVRDGRRCQSPGCGRPATDVHHKVTITRAPHLRLDLANLVSLCKECHSSITAKRDSTFAHRSW